METPEPPPTGAEPTHAEPVRTEPTSLTRERGKTSLTRERGKTSLTRERGKTSLTRERGKTSLTHERGKTLRAPVILDTLAEEIPDAVIALEFSDRWELLAATMLSAQSTDVKVNQVTRVLFAELPGPEAVASAPLERLEVLIGQLGLFRQKAKNLQATARMLLEHHGGEVPGTMPELLALPGVARKTANVVLSNGFGLNEGVVVDTHVARVSRRLRFTREDDPKRIERDLMRLFPRQRWLEVSDLLIHHGRRTCDARRPRCEDCVIEPLCPSSQEAGLTDKR